jgi:hypothetical protein
METKRPKKCPHCNSKRVTICGYKFVCSKCGFINDIEFQLKNNLSQSK